jgi:integrase
MHATLSSKVVRDLSPRPDGGDLLVFDNELPGFGVRVYPSGVKSYFWNDRQGRLSLGDVRNMRLEQARDLAREYKAMARRGINVRRHLREEREANQAEERRSQLTLQTAFAEYARIREGGLAGTTAWSRSTGEAYRAAWKWIQQEVGDSHPADIGAPDWVSMLAEHREERPAMAKTMLALMKSLYAWLSTQSTHAKDVTTNPVRDVKFTALPAREQYFAPADLGRLYHAVDVLDVFESTAIRLLILTARRRSEIEELRWDEVDFAERVITIPKERTKTGREDAFPMTDRMVDLLKAVPRHNGPYVFSRDGGHRPMKLNLKRARASLGDVPAHTGVDWRFHDFRRSMATAIDNADGDHSEKEIMLSHSLGALDKTYSRSNRLGIKRKWLEWWDAQICGGGHAQR